MKRGEGGGSEGQGGKEGWRTARRESIVPLCVERERVSISQS